MSSALKMIAGFVSISVCLAGGGCAAPSLGDPHGHVVEVHARPWAADLTPDVKLIQVEPLPASARKNLVSNPSGTVRAYLVDRTCQTALCREDIRLEYAGTGDTYEIQGVPLDYRPYSDLAWVNDRYFVFDRWSQPHYGIHYVVDAVERRLVHASPFPDEFYLDSQKPKAQSNQPAAEARVE